jgi:hypothetical protein
LLCCPHSLPYPAHNEPHDRALEQIETELDVIRSYRAYENIERTTSAPEVGQELITQTSILDIRIRSYFRVRVIDDATPSFPGGCRAEPEGACESISSISILLLPGLASLVTSKMWGVYGARIPIGCPLNCNTPLPAIPSNRRSTRCPEANGRQFDNPRQSGGANRMIRRRHRHCVVQAPSIQRSQ